MEELKRRVEERLARFKNMLPNLQPFSEGKADYEGGIDAYETVLAWIAELEGK